MYEVYALTSEKAVEIGDDEDIIQKNEVVASLTTHMSAFRDCYWQGYAWFSLIDALACDGGVSGLAVGKHILLEDLQHAQEVARTHDPQGKLARDGYDAWEHRKPQLMEFMQKCIDWCNNNSKDRIYIYFG
ncbi:MAG: hypothetical protein RTU92_01435 [Candidatus Thorarchaeota archaeon]